MSFAFEGANTDGLTSSEQRVGQQHRPHHPNLRQGATSAELAEAHLSVQPPEWGQGSNSGSSGSGHGIGKGSSFGTSADGFGISANQLVALVNGSDVDALRQMGGVAGLCQALRVNPEAGIPEEDAADTKRRQDEFGTNTYPKRPHKSFLSFAWRAAQDTTLIILMVCGVVSLIAKMLTKHISEGWYEGVAIFIAVFIVITVTALTDYQQSLQFRKLSAEKANIQLKVLRGGRVQTVSIFNLLVGDIAPLSIGDQVPGDGVLVSGHSLTIDESSMTGESDPMLKTAEKPFLLSGCKVVDGVGTMLITAVGGNTEWGRVMATLSDDEVAKTPLQTRLGLLVTRIGAIGVSVAVLVLIILLVRFGVAYEPESAAEVVEDVVDILLIAVTIIVVAIPEGLPLAVTLTLGYSMRKMMADKALVRHLAACETMGSATTICSDKTGTLTLNQMTPMQEWVAGDLQDCGSGKAPSGTLWKDISEGIAQNSTASVYVTEDGTPEVTGSPTETAVINWALQLGLDFNAERTSSTIVSVETFNSTKKRAGVAVKRADGSVRVHWKGAAEIIVGQCTTYMARDGESHLLDADMTKIVLDSISVMAGQSLRCIGIACRTMPASAVPSDADSWKFPDTNLTLLAIVGIKDPCRPGVPDAVARCQRAGVKVRMVTGDNILTARAIASECGILTPNGVVIEGKDFRGLSEEEMVALIPKIDVMARSSPTDKHLLVKMLRQMGDVVAVTGDGTNDAPALKEADIGLSMGITGTEVAKESSDIVILDDNFTSIVKVLRWGRSVFANIQKYLQFQLTVNIVALSLNFIAACSGTGVPLTTIQLLWVNLIMNTMGALALATERPTEELMKRKPMGRTAPVISNVMWRNMLGMAAYQLAVLLVLNFNGQSMLNLGFTEFGLKVNRTIIFNTFVFCQLFNEINARKPDKFNVFRGLHTNPLFILIWFISLGFQITVVEVLQRFASTVGLTWAQWLFCIIVGFLGMPLAALVKLIPVPTTPFSLLLFGKGWQKSVLGRDLDLIPSPPESNEDSFSPSSDPASAPGTSGGASAPLTSA